MLRKHPERAAEVLRRPAPKPFAAVARERAPAPALAPRWTVDSVQGNDETFKPRSRGVPLPTELVTPSRKKVVQVPDAKKAVGGAARRKALKSLAGPR